MTSEEVARLYEVLCEETYFGFNMKCVLIDPSTPAEEVEAVTSFVQRCRRGRKKGPQLSVGAPQVPAKDLWLIDA